MSKSCFLVVWWVHGLFACYQKDQNTKINQSILIPVMHLKPIILHLLSWWSNTKIKTDLKVSVRLPHLGMAIDSPHLGLSIFITCSSHHASLKLLTVQSMLSSKVPSPSALRGTLSDADCCEPFVLGTFQKVDCLFTPHITASYPPMASWRLCSFLSCQTIQPYLMSSQDLLICRSFYDLI